MGCSMHGDVNPKLQLMLNKGSKCSLWQGVTSYLQLRGEQNEITMLSHMTERYNVIV